jgi:hypothetical protein
MLAHGLEMLLAFLGKLLKQLLSLGILYIAGKEIHGLGAVLFHAQEVFQVHQFF